MWGKRTLATLVGAALISVPVTTVAGHASAAPEPVVAHAAEARQPTAILVTVDQHGRPINTCMMHGDTLETRAVIGAVLGGLAGLPIFVVGAIPGALVGAGFGALSWVIADQSLRQIPGCR